MFNLLNLKTSCTRINVINKLQFVYQGLKGNSKVKDYTFCKTYHTSLKNPVRVNHSRYKESVEKSNKNIDFLNPNTNVQNNVLLYKMESNYFHVLRFFACGAVVFSALLMYTTFDEKLKFWKSDMSIKEYLKINGFNIIFFFYGGLMGPLIFWVVSLTAKRFVKYIILHKGGEEVSIITYHLFKDQIALRVPTYEVQSFVARREMKSYIPMKIRGQRFFYLVDSSGTFLNDTLFDNTIGMGKRWRD